MELNVDINNVILKQIDQIESGEYNVTECNFTFTDKYAELTKKAVFTGDDDVAYVETIVDGKCAIPSEILTKSQKVEIGVYGYAVDGTELLLRYSPMPTSFYINQGSYKEANNSTPPTPSEVEQLQAQITQNANDIEDIQDNIVEINEQQEIQDETIQNNTEAIGTINETIGEINQDIDNLENTKADKSEIPTKTSDLINDSDFVSDSNYVHTDNNFTNEYKAQITTNANNITTLQNTKADKSEIPTKTSDLINDNGFIADVNYVHTDNNFTDEYKAQITTNANNITTLQSTKADKSEIPTKVSELDNDSGYIDNTVDDLTNYTKSSDLSTVATSGSYNDLSNKPTIPANTSDLNNDSGFITKSVNDLTYYTLKTNTGSLIDLEINGTTYVITLSLKDQDGNVISTDTIDLPLESVVVGGSYDSINQKIVLTLQNGNTVDIPVGALVSGLQTEITSQNKLASDLVDDSNSGNKFVTTSEKQTWNGKYDKPVGGIPKADLASDVQTSLGKADTAIQEHQDITGKEDKSNKVTSISSSSTDTQYPSAKCVYDLVGDIANVLDVINGEVV